MKTKVVKGENCLNCDTQLNDANYCPNCGQLNNTAKPTLYHLVMDALANLFAFDSKFYLSIWPLLRHPGTMSLEVANGKHATYLPPIRLFLLITILMLGLRSATDRFNRSWADVEHLKQTSEPFFVLDSTRVKEVSTTKITFDNSKNGNKLEQMYSYAAANPDKKVEEGLADLQLEATFWNSFFYTSFLKLTIMDGQEFKDYINSNLLLILLLFIPILAFVLKALYFYKKDYFYVDHFIFSIHTQTAFFVFIIFQTITGWFLGDYTVLLLFFVFPIYLFYALKNFYKQSNALTAFNFFIVNVSFVIVSVIFLLLVSFVSFILI